MQRVDPIFGMEALKELDRKCNAKIKSPKFKDHPKIKYRKTKLYQEQMRYRYLGEFD